ncbi:uncharacterized protein LOC18431278 [Amborella trichopoda]|nr:uncharacterized protein LOC18431278 [Amborella trichopoda]XP_011622220.1 uncharacterized protein LOC18431278 [Amborella trichopoda]XP_020521197.1 uncharacterized protein LOC18431278 [Amborella trichopoda]XP_020521198.1 uncharacterized protein LOC18431278 [Amborella trichopoda]XP_020521199.1 uncharacterized protein LOC18431278 [Amborella trichopoda]|eukprot:XP_006841467.2 uncharacterized protein LOC18431278 [Amborella trichopoda]
MTLSGHAYTNIKALDHQEILAECVCNDHMMPYSSIDLPLIDRKVSSSITNPCIMCTIFSPFLNLNEDQSETAFVGNAAEHDSCPHAMIMGAEDGDSQVTGNGAKSSNIPDFQLPDLTTVNVAADGCVRNHDSVLSEATPGFECNNFDMMCDISDNYMLWHCNEENAENYNSHDMGSLIKCSPHPDDACLFCAIQLNKPSDFGTDIFTDCMDLDEVNSFDPYLSITSFPDFSEIVPSHWPNLLPRQAQKRDPMTLVLDLDETLVHSKWAPCKDADFTFKVFLDKKEHTVYVRQRPYLRVFLEKVSEIFEVIIFTASQRIYAEQLLNILDPNKKIFRHRVYRDSCIASEGGGYMKDLRILGRDLAKVAIIDNSPQVFRLQVENGIPIKSWYNDKSDCALLNLLPFLETLADAEDVRPLIAKKFGNQ